MSSLSVCSESIEILDRFTYFGNVSSSNGRSESEVSRRLLLTYGIMGSLNQCLALQSSKQKDEASCFQDYLASCFAPQS